MYVLSVSVDLHDAERIMGLKKGAFTHFKDLIDKMDSLDRLDVSWIQNLFQGASDWFEEEVRGFLRDLGTKTFLGFDRKVGLSVPE